MSTDTAATVGWLLFRDAKVSEWQLRHGANLFSHPFDAIRVGFPLHYLIGDPDYHIIGRCLLADGQEEPVTNVAETRFEHAVVSQLRVDTSKPDVACPGPF